MLFSALNATEVRADGAAGAKAAAEPARRAREEAVFMVGLRARGESACFGAAGRNLKLDL